MCQRRGPVSSSWEVQRPDGFFERAFAPAGKDIVECRA